MRVILLLLAACVASVGYSQSVVIKKVELAGELVIVHYDLDDSNPNNEYLINLYSSKDNYFAALKHVSGDVGMDIKPGVDRKISWRIRDEFGGYKGKISLEIRGKVYVPFVRLQEFDPKKTRKKGTTINLKWRVGNSNPINIELYNGGERVAGEINQPNNGSHALFIPKHAANSKEYRIKFTDTKNSDEVIYTDYFKVAPKIPMVAKIAAGVVVVGGIVFILASKGGGPSGGDDPIVEDKTIPLPDTP